MSFIYAPFTIKQAHAINEWQAKGEVHPFTCGNDSGHGALVAEPNFLRCPFCDYTQNWVHNFMVSEDK